MKRFLLAAGLCVVWSSSAFATGGFSCSIDDEVLKLDVESSFSHGLGEALLNPSGTVEIRDPFASERLRRIAIDKSRLPHHWLYGKELKLRIYAETEEGPFSSLDLAIETVSEGDEETGYSGTYRMVLYRAEPLPGSTEQQIEKTGRASCSAG
ncbi:hypothetical protein [Pararhizobium gei]|uniref:hypothetical protein n=1 Tax=Pararhizobium gei TaxID=1395951 RepID=UPI0023DACA56|nr:hypothetical protein [Rhizobium gei]